MAANLYYGLHKCSKGGELPYVKYCRMSFAGLNGA